METLFNNNTNATTDQSLHYTTRSTLCPDNAWHPQLPTITVEGRFHLPQSPQEIGTSPPPTPKRVLVEPADGVDLPRIEESNRFLKDGLPFAMDGTSFRRGGGSPTPPQTPIHNVNFTMASSVSDMSKGTKSALPALPTVSPTPSPSPSSIIATSSPKAAMVELPEIPDFFPHWESGYQENDLKELGSGVWSTVYLAPAASPPVCPAYAIKVPSSKRGKSVIEHEAKVLTTLSRIPDYSSHIVQFFGLDSRNGALVLRAYDTTLESWISNPLNKAPKDARNAMLATLFQTGVISNLLRSLAWLSSHGIVHGDIKPGNILLQLSPLSSLPTHMVLADFSSAFLQHDANRKHTPEGGGTWDFLDPILCKWNSPSPTPINDLYALAMSLLVLVLGHSPFDVAPNDFLKRDLIKKGEPMKYIAALPSGDDRFKALEGSLRWDVRGWFHAVLKKDPARREGLEEWAGMLGNGVK